MTPKNFLKGYEYYICAIDTASLAKDPVLLHKHPVEMERVVVYDRTSIDQWLSTHQYKCMNTRQVLTLDQREHVSIKKEMVAFLLDASKAYSTFSPEELKKYDGVDIDGTITNELTKAYNEIQVYLKELSSESVLEEAKKLLADLANDDRANIPFDGIGRLIGFGIEADYNKQRIYAQSQPLPPQQARPIQSAPPQPIQQNNNIGYNQLNFLFNNLLLNNLIHNNNAQQFQAQRTEADEKAEAEARLEMERQREYERNYSMTMGFGEMLQVKIPASARRQISHFEFWHNGKKMHAWPTATPAFFDEIETTGFNLTHLLDNPAADVNKHHASIKMINMTGQVLKERQVTLLRDKNLESAISNSNNSRMMYGYQQNNEATIKALAEAKLEAERQTEYERNNSMSMGFGEMLKIKIPALARKQISHLEFWYNNERKLAWPPATAAFFDEAETTGLNLTHLLGNTDPDFNQHSASIKMIGMSGQVLKERSVAIYRDPKHKTYYMSSISKYRWNY